MEIYPAVHYAMGGLWVDYGLMSNIAGLFVLGEANFSDHGANRLGASALMQGLADGYFVIPYTIAPFLAGVTPGAVTTEHPAFRESEAAVRLKQESLLAIKGERTVDDFHKELGRLLWDDCGVARNKEGLQDALKKIPVLKDEFWQNLKLPGSGDGLNQSLERAGRVADFIEFGQLMVQDALKRQESCGCHLREESQTEDGEAKRDDSKFSHVSAWEYGGEGKEAIFHKEELIFENVKLSQRSYK